MFNSLALQFLNYMTCGSFLILILFKRILVQFNFYALFEYLVPLTKLEKNEMEV